MTSATPETPQRKREIYKYQNTSSCCLSVLSIPDSVEAMCPGMPRLDGLMKDINDMAESGARYTEMPHVIEVVLPMLCNYLSYWWERGPENQPASGGSVCCTTVTSEHLSLILGNILKILNNNLGIDEASWMKRIAGRQRRRGAENTTGN